MHEDLEHAHRQHLGAAEQARRLLLKPFDRPVEAVTAETAEIDCHGRAKGVVQTQPETGYEQPAEVGGDAAQPLSGRDMSSEVAGGPAADERCCFRAERPESGGQTRALQLQSAGVSPSAGDTT